MLTLSKCILKEDIALVENALREGAEINCIDEYGFTPLIEAAIVDNLAIAELLLRYGADATLADARGGTALHWTAENNNPVLAKRLLAEGADPNAYGLSGQPVLVMPFLRGQREIRNLLIENGASLEFAKDYVNTKLLGHLFELVGTGCIVSPAGKNVEVNFEGFFPEVTIAIIADALQQFGNHYAARRMRQYAEITLRMIEALFRAQRLSRFQQYRVDQKKYQTEITTLMQEDPLILAVGYEGHAITFIRMKNFFIKCDRREDSRLYDNIVVYRIGRQDRLTTDFLQQLIYTPQSFDSVNIALPAWLALQPVVEIPVPAQISGNCSWANVEATIPAMFYMLSSDAKKRALDYFQTWREWNCNRTLQFAKQRFREIQPHRRAVLAETLAAILFQICAMGDVREEQRAEEIFSMLLSSGYEYLLQHYIKVYAFEDIGEAGRRFLAFATRHGYDPRTR